MSDESTFKIDKNQVPNPKSTPTGDNQVKGTPSDAQIHKMAKDEDMGKV